jgi:hypothetical protein
MKPVGLINRLLAFQMLNSYSIPIKFTSLDKTFLAPINRIVYVADHTYVTSSKGHKWGCNGRDSGGVFMDSANANIDEAACLHRNDLAGIYYGITGVCHQIANRTLHPAGLKVEKAKCYFISRAMYGEYGYYKASWKRRQKECYFPYTHETEYDKLSYALEMQRNEFLKYGIPEKEIADMFHGIQSDFYVQLEKYTRQLRINFLTHAIEYFYSEKIQSNFVELVNNELNSYLSFVVEVLGLVSVGKLLGFEEYAKQTYIVLFQNIEKES